MHSSLPLFSIFPLSAFPFLHTSGDFVLLPHSFGFSFFRAFVILCSSLSAAFHPQWGLRLAAAQEKSFPDQRRTMGSE